MIVYYREKVIVHLLEGAEIEVVINRGKVFTSSSLTFQPYLS